MRRGRWACFLILLAAGARSQELGLPMVSTAPDAGETEVVFSTDAAAGPERPAWSLRAARLFQEGVGAEAAGNTGRARKKYAQALKVFADKAEDADVLERQKEIAALLDPVEAVEPAETDKPFFEEAVPSLLPAAPKPDGGVHTYAVAIDPEDPAVQRFVSLYTGPLRDRLQASFDRMGQYQEFILKEIDALGLPRELQYLPIVESEYQPFAVSRAGAVGVWQFMPATAKYAGLKINSWVDERRDPLKSTRAALRTLKTLYEWFDDWHLALAAYNRGMYGVQRDMEFTRSTDFAALSRRDGLPRETEQYVPKWMACVIVGESAAARGFRPPDPARRPPPDEVVLEKPLDLKIAAACAQVSEEEIRRLNPSLRLWVTPKNEENFSLKIPPGSKPRFLAALAQVKDWTPSPGFVKYKVQKGDVLGRIARQYRTTTEALQRENKIANPNRLRPGQVLVIRPGRGFKGNQ